MTAPDSYETLLVQRENYVTVVTLNRPPVNAVNRIMQAELTEVFEGFVDDAETRAIILRGGGDRAFCGGIDLKEVGVERANGARTVPLAERVNPGSKWRRTQHAIRHAPVPVIAAVEAPAIGAGFGLIGVCDIIVASTTATFGLPEINVGLLGGASKALRMLGPFKARTMMFTGIAQTAQELYRLGAIERMVEPGRAFAEARGIAELIVSKSPIATRLAKESILRIETDEMELQYRTEWDYTNRLASFSDAEEAMSAYLEKREPHWRLR